MIRRLSGFLAASALSTICSATLLAVTATRETMPLYITWLTTSLALFYIYLCFAATTSLRSPSSRLEAQPDHQGGVTDIAVLQDCAALETGVGDSRNTYSLGTFYWCSPGLQCNSASASTSRTPDTVVHKPLQSSSKLLSSTTQSSPMPPGLSPAAYFDPSDVDLKTTSMSRIEQIPAIQVPLPLPVHYRR